MQKQPGWCLTVDKITIFRSGVEINSISIASLDENLYKKNRKEIPAKNLLIYFEIDIEK